MPPVKFPATPRPRVKIPIIQGIHKQDVVIVSSVSAGRNAFFF